ncbi:unnamed protein product [Triticum turgidum subsp. durum]|uniref:Uncharacterized protein n=1 Tax=Triticum turgidum subsp. durum TaxID=4567 RepID=A0A9R0XUU7_TRITD|nr:unnamed protein product [Triticum turgidum subsp. durum]
MSMVQRPFGVNPCAAGGHLRRHHARLCLRRASSVDATTGNLPGGSSSSNRRRKKQAAEESQLEVLYDDGFGSVTMKDYWEAVRAMPRDDGGPPRWFCPVECGRPVVDRAPLLLFLPGTDGVGMELILHHQSLGKLFEVCCFHIPVNDRTSFEGCYKLWKNMSNMRVLCHQVDQYILLEILLVDVSQFQLQLAIQKSIWFLH